MLPLRYQISYAGFELQVELVPVRVADSHTLSDVERILRLTPEQRLLEVRKIARFEQAARRV